MKARHMGATLKESMEQITARAGWVCAACGRNLAHDMTVKYFAGTDEVTCVGCNLPWPRDINAKT